MSLLRDSEIVFVTNTLFTPWLARSQAAIAAEFLPPITTTSAS